MIGRASTLDELSGSLLWALSRTGDAAPGAADVPLVDYIRARVAIVAATARWAAGTEAGAGEPSFLWVTGDLSGIQAYLYRIAAIGEGGVARRLRARSLFLQLLAEDTAEALQRALDLPRANILMRAGGRFHLLLPDIPAARTALAEMQARLDRWLLRETYGEVALVLAWEAVAAAALRPGALGDTLRRLDARLARAKAARFAAALRLDGRWDEAAFLRPAAAGARRCPSCRMGDGLPGGPAEALCRRCAADTAAGRALPRERTIALIAGGNGAAGIDLPNSVAVLGQSHPGAILTMPLRDAPVPGEAGGFGGHIPSADGAPLTFEQIAARGRGRPLLGYLKMDVDRLGEIFAFGFRRDGGPGFDSLPRIAAVSRLLDEFFGRRLTALIGSEFPLCYQVYAGGDDVLVIGPWWETLRLALRIRDQFRAWVNGNPEITISAGLALTGYHTPVALAATLADDELEQAKQGRANAGAALREARRRRGCPPEQVEHPAPAAACVPSDGRDCASLLGDLLSWEHLALVADEAARLAALQPPRTLLHRLLGFGDMWTEYRDGDPAGLRLFPYLDYLVRRTVDRRSQPDLWAWVQQVTGSDYRSGGEQTPLEHLGLLARLTLLLTEGARA